MWQTNGGKCGVCGDNYQERTPRSHELGGKFGQGVIVKTYQSGGVLPVDVQLSANHMGNFYFQLCNLDANNGQETDACFEQNKLRLTNGADRYTLTVSGPGRFPVQLQIPAGLRCNHCVLQWTYVAGKHFYY